ncbi:ABC transporter permease [Bacillus sp. Bva_UNVM-123]|uniref:ABC transporter permease n=1 Tax=Bacillus sp. Bva_UNVM-123 TaxID=2829798 RepID=UPI00391F2D43
MIGAFLKKQLLVFVRNPQVIILQLVMPLVLISILGFALKGMFEGEKSPIEARIAYVSHGNEEKDVELFRVELQKSELPAEVKGVIDSELEKTLPLKLMKEAVFTNSKVRDFIDFEELQPQKLAALKKDKDYAVIIEVPENFTYNLLMTVFLPEHKDSVKSELTLYHNEDQELAAQLVAEMTEQFQHQYTLRTVLGKKGINLDEAVQQEVGMTISKQAISAVKPVSAMVYYLIGISMMFVLYVASDTGTFAFAEKESNVFIRIMLSGASSFSYLLGTFFSAVLIALFQLWIIFGFTRIVYGVVWDDFAGFFVITLCIAIAVGGFAVVVTALNYRFHSQAVSNFFSSVVVTILALLGGTFVPMKAVSEIIATIGKYTPNGAAMNAYLQVYQGYGLHSVTSQLVTLCIFGIVFIMIGAFIFPKEVRH